MKKITVAVCVDDDMQIMFFGKRQSRDSVLISELISSASGKVYINEFSQPIFPDAESYALTLNPISDCPDGGTVFAENIPLAPHISVISRLVVYKWNRKYPGDRKLDINLSSGGFRLTAVSDFVGSSHEKITKEIYERIDAQ